MLNFLSNSLKFTQNYGFIKVHLNILEEEIIKNTSNNETVLDDI